MKRSHVVIGVCFSFCCFVILFIYLFIGENETFTCWSEFVLDFRTSLDQGVSTFKSYPKYTLVLFSPLFLFSPKNIEVGTL